MSIKNSPLSLRGEGRNLMTTRIVKPAKKKRKTGWGGKRTTMGRPRKYGEKLIREMINFPESDHAVIKKSTLEENLSFSEVVVKLVRKGMLHVEQKTHQ